MASAEISGIMDQLVAVVSETSNLSRLLAGTAVVIAASFIFLGRSRDDRSFPRWIPIEIGAVSYLLGAKGTGLRIYSAIRKNSGSLFGLSSTHQIIHNFPGTDRFLAQGHHVLDGFPRDWALSNRVFGVDSDEEVRSKLEKYINGFNSLTEKMFVNEANASAAIERANIAEKAFSLTTFATQPEDLALWERSANVRIVQPETESQGGIAEADFLSLVRDFGACISIPQLYGQDFLDRNSTLLKDFWTFDNDLFPLLMIGIPSWAPLKMIKDGIAARSRLHAALEGLYRRADQYLKGEPVDFGADMSDIGMVVRERTKGYNEYGVTFRHRGQVDLGNFWGQNANTQPSVFWFLLYIYSTPGLADELRKELAPYVTVSDSTPRKITSFDSQALFRNCTLLKATMYETFRMTNQPTSIRYAKRDLTLKDGAFEQKLKAGTWISVTHSTINKDPAIFHDPNQFIPDRFLETDADTGARAARMGKLRPWGGGVGICKGRSFAEKEILSIGATVLSLWDIGPVGPKWELPDMLPGTGIMRPVRDIRVTLKRRT